MGITDAEEVHGCWLTNGSVSIVVLVVFLRNLVEQVPVAFLLLVRYDTSTEVRLRMVSLTLLVKAHHVDVGGLGGHDFVSRLGEVGHHLAHRVGRVRHLLRRAEVVQRGHVAPVGVLPADFSAVVAQLRVRRSNRYVSH